MPNGSKPAAFGQFPSFGDPIVSHSSGRFGRTIDFRGRRVKSFATKTLISGSSGRAVFSPSDRGRRFRKRKCNAT